MRYVAQGFVSTVVLVKIGVMNIEVDFRGHYLSLSEASEASEVQEKAAALDHQNTDRSSLLEVAMQNI